MEQGASKAMAAKRVMETLKGWLEKDEEVCRLQLRFLSHLRLENGQLDVDLRETFEASGSSYVRLITHLHSATRGCELEDASSVAAKIAFTVLHTKELGLIRDLAVQPKGLPEELHSLILIGLAFRFEAVNRLTRNTSNSDFWAIISSGDFFNKSFMLFNLNHTAFHISTPYNAGDVMRSASCAIRGTTLTDEMDALVQGPEAIELWTERKVVESSNFMRSVVGEIEKQLATGDHDPMIFTVCDQLAKHFQLDRQAFIAQLEDIYGFGGRTLITERLVEVWEEP